MNYTDENRGKIQHEDYARRIVDFSGMRYGNITPTDVDGVIEYHDTHVVFFEFKYGVVFFEFKYGNAPIPNGQKMALERIVDNCANAGKLAILCICRHKAPEGHHIDAAQSLVSDVYIGGGGYVGGKWYPEMHGRNLRQVCDAFLGWRA